MRIFSTYCRNIWFYTFKRNYLYHERGQTRWPRVFCEALPDTPFSILRKFTKRGAAVFRQIFLQDLTSPYTHIFCEILTNKRTVIVYVSQINIYMWVCCPPVPFFCRGTACTAAASCPCSRTVPYHLCGGWYGLRLSPVYIFLVSCTRCREDAPSSILCFPSATCPCIPALMRNVQLRDAEPYAHRNTYRSWGLRVRDAYTVLLVCTA